MESKIRSRGSDRHKIFTCLALVALLAIGLSHLRARISLDYGIESLFHKCRILVGGKIWEKSYNTCERSVVAYNLAGILAVHITCSIDNRFAYCHLSGLRKPFAVHKAVDIH